MFGSQSHNFFHATGKTAVVHDNDCFGARGDLALDLGRVNGELIRPHDIGETHIRTGVKHGIGGGHKSQRGHNHLITRADAQGQTGQVQRLGGVGDSERKFTAS